MHTFYSLKSRIEEELSAIQLDKRPEELYEPIRYSLSLSAKRVRPLLVLAATELFGGDIDKAMKPALGIEVFHNYTLLHDDIMDNAPIRRSKPTVFAKWGLNVAILSGDAMFVKACELVSHADSHCLKEVLGVFYSTALEVCEGQQLDMNYEKLNRVEISRYIEMIRLKTAVLLAGSLKIGAIMANANNEDTEKIYGFGECIGIAFQLRDDLLDVYGENKFGKRVGGDILSNKKTYLLLKTLELANTEQKSNLNNWLLKSEYSANEKIEAITSIFNQVEVKKYAEAEIEYYYKKGLKYLENVSVENEKKSVLLDFAESLMYREV